MEILWEWLTAYSFPRSLVLHNILVIEAALLLDDLHGLWRLDTRTACWTENLESAQERWQFQSFFHLVLKFVVRTDAEGLLIFPRGTEASCRLQIMYCQLWQITIICLGRRYSLAKPCWKTELNWGKSDGDYQQPYTFLPTVAKAVTVTLKPTKKFRVYYMSKSYFGIIQQLAKMFCSLKAREANL